MKFKKKFINIGKITRFVKKDLKFLKTHNSLIKAFGNDFTHPKYSLGVVYIIRIRNVIIKSASKDKRFKINSLTEGNKLQRKKSLVFYQN